MKQLAKAFLAGASQAGALCTLSTSLCTQLRHRCLDTHIELAKHVKYLVRGDTLVSQAFMWR